MRAARAVPIALALLALAAAAAAQPAAPLSAALVLRNPPPGAVYPPGAPVELQLEVANVSGGPVITTAGFSQAQAWRRLVFVDQRGGILTNATAAAGLESDTRVSACLSRAGVLLSPLALQVVPVEVLPEAFALRYEIDDARRFYGLGPGRYTVTARIPLLTFQAAAGGIVEDCDQFEGETLAVLGALSPGAGTTIVSNEVQFTVASPNQLVFKGLKPDAACPGASVTPCKTVAVGKPIGVQFQVLDPARVPVPDLTGRVALTRVGGGLAALPVNVAAYNARRRQYLLDLPTRGLEPGPWRIDVTIEEDGTVHTTHVMLKGRKSR